MKESWEYKRLEEICDFRSGFAFKSNKFTKMGEPIIRISDIQNEEIDDSNLVYFDPKSYTEDLSKYLIYPDDILIAMSGGTTGKLGINTSKRTFYLNQRVGVFRENKKYLNHRYLYYFLHTKSEESLRIAAGAAQPNLSTAQIKSFIIPVPPLSQQQSIVDYLDSAFAKIDAMKANAEKALNEAKALFQASLKEMLEPKEGWEEKVFGDLVVSNIVGLTRGKVEQGYDRKYPYFKMNNISPNNTLCWDDLICVDANEEELEKYCLQEGDFLFNTRNSKEWVGKSTVYRDYDAPVMLYNNNVMRIRFVDTINPVFVAYSFLADYTKDQLEKIKSGTTNVWAIYYRDLSKILLTYPLLSEQQSIVETLDSLKSKVDRLQENYDKISQECDALKQAILRQVFE